MCPTQGDTDGAAELLHEALDARGLDGAGPLDDWEVGDCNT